MRITKPIIKEISEAIGVFLFAVFINFSSVFKKYVMRGENYTNSDLIVAVILALVLTIAFVLFKRKYYRIK
jgi:hypothetical protein